MWQDEIARYDQMRMPVWDAFKSLFSEPSPFAPGELVLGFISKFLFGSWTSFEFWGRLPVVLWGSATLALAVRQRDPLLVGLLIFSTSLTSFTTQFRPYGALIFGGALAFRMVAIQTPLARWERFLVWFSILFGHLYGICFVGLACFLKRRWWPTVTAALYVVGLLIIYRSVHDGSIVVWKDTHTWNFDFREAAQHTLRAVFNPYRTAFLLLPIAAIGFISTWRRNKTCGLHATIILLVMSIGPVIANYLGKYYFTPRQIVSLIFPALVFSSLGIKNLIHFSRRFKFHKIIKVAISSLVILVMLRAWTLFVINGRPPFADQPLHRHKHIAERLLKENSDLVVLVDPGGTGYHYFIRALGPPSIDRIVRLGEFEFRSRVWTHGFELFHFDQSDFAWRDLGELAHSEVFRDYLKAHQSRIDGLIYNSEKFHLETSIPSFRAW